MRNRLSDPTIYKIVVWVCFPPSVRPSQLEREHGVLAMVND